MKRTPSRRSGPSPLLARFRYEYGAGPGHLVAGLIAIAIAVWAGQMVLGFIGRPENVVKWFIGSILLHDIVAVPIYSAVGLAVATVVLRRDPTPLRLAVLNHLRIPAALAGVALLVWYPLILAKATPSFEHAAGFAPPDYMGRWLILTAVLFAISAIILCVRLPTLRSRS